MSAYDKGSIFLSQLQYVIGKENFDKTLKKYFNDWSFKHPKPNDFIRSAEKVSGLELDWYLLDWAQSTMTIDYSVNSLYGVDNKTRVVLKRIGQMGMPIDLRVELISGEILDFNIPMTKMRGSKPLESSTLLKSWSWAKPYYEFWVDLDIKNISKILIDPKNEMADINRTNNSLDL